MTTAQYRYAARTLLGDALRSAFGAGACVLLLSQSPPPVVAGITGAFLVLFAWFGVRTAIRRLMIIEIDDRAIRCCAPYQTTIAWDDLTGVKLRYYSTRRDRRAGWMELLLTSSSGKLRLESTLTGFDRIAQAVAAAVRHRQIVADDGTITNFLALGCDPGPDGQRP
ncbi:MAG: hypothetical protein P4M00_22505 [Azospirillaceae bacterium]|nr:hypothetical protein [Azospirillaceae bacterium]